MTHKIIAYFQNIQRKDILFYGGIGIFLFLLLFILGLQFSYTITSSYFNLNKSAIDKNIAIVALDEETLNSHKFKRYQDIDRCDHANLLRNILYGDPKIVVVDMVFYQKGENEACDNELKDILQKNPNVIVGVEYDETRKTLHTDIFWEEWRSKNIALVNTTSYNSLNVFNFHLADYKNRVKIYDARKNPILPLAIEAYKQARGFKEAVLTETDIVFDGREKIPLDEGEFVNINFFTSSYPTVSFIDILENPNRSRMFEWKTVFIGATAQDIHDEFLTPFDTSNFIPGVMIHANLYNTLMTKRFIEYENIPTFFLVNFLAILLFTAILVWTVSIFSWVFYSFLVVVGYTAFSLLAFRYFGMIIEIFPLIVAYIFVSLAIYLKKYLEEKHSKDQVRAIFSRYISEDVANELIKQGVENMHLGGAEREVTVFFSDLAGFTDLSESLKPDELGRILNVYFEEMSSIILAEKGTIDKFIGDAIMAFWNAPLDLPRHANNACTAA
ncbi:MAG: Adenylate cyclase, partial [uncultured bacterium (gcode 4)]